MSQIPVVDILGIKVSVVDRPLLLAEIDRLAASGQVALVNNVNVHACNLAYAQSDFREVLNASEVVFCDGFGVKMGARLLGKRLGERLTPPDWIDDLFVLCVSKGYSVYFLGDTDEVVGGFARKVKLDYPELEVAGWHNGFFDLHGTDNECVVKTIAGTGADIIVTGMGMPRQELWAWEAKGQLNKGWSLLLAHCFGGTPVMKSAPLAG